jgi:RpiB/LacA/LacB family sugar-phosphate isomerase
MLYIASDHGGFILKEELKKELLAHNLQIEDLGPNGLNIEDDYPDFAKALAQKISADSKSFGILICRSGQGVCIVANKFKGVRAALAWNEETARVSKTDDWSNVLCLPSDFLSAGEAARIVNVWLNTEWGSDERFSRRIHKIDTIEASLH